MGHRKGPFTRRVLQRLSLRHTLAHCKARIQICRLFRGVNQLHDRLLLTISSLVCRLLRNVLHLTCKVFVGHLTLKHLVLLAHPPIAQGCLRLLLVLQKKHVAGSWRVDVLRRELNGTSMI